MRRGRSLLQAVCHMASMLLATMMTRDALFNKLSRFGNRILSRCRNRRGRPRRRAKSWQRVTGAGRKHRRICWQNGLPNIPTTLRRICNMAARCSNCGVSTKRWLLWSARRRSAPLIRAYLPALVKFMLRSNVGRKRKNFSSARWRVACKIATFMANLPMRNCTPIATKRQLKIMRRLSRWEFRPAQIRAAWRYTIWPALMRASAKKRKHWKQSRVRLRKALPNVSIWRRTRISRPFAPKGASKN